VFCGEKKYYGSRADDEKILNIELRMRNGYDLLKLIKLIRRIKLQRINILHIHNGSLISVLFKLFNKNLKIIVHFHASTVKIDSEHEKIRFFIINFILYKLVDLFIANSNYTARINQKRYNLDKNIIKIIPCGVSINELIKRKSIKDGALNKKLTAFDKIVGVVANLAPAKGLNYFIEIADSIVRVNNKIGFWIIGDGVLKKQLQSLIKSKRLENNVFLLGRRDDVPFLLTKMDVFLFTSVWEAFGIVLLEAMALEIPIVAFSNEGVLSILNEENALIVDNQNISLGAECVQLLLNDETLRKKLTRQAKKDVMKYDIKLTSEKITSLYSKILYAR